MQLFCIEDSPVHSRLCARMYLQVEYYQNILTNQTNFASESASSIIRWNYENASLLYGGTQ